MNSKEAVQMDLEQLIGEAKAAERLKRDIDAAGALTPQVAAIFDAAAEDMMARTCDAQVQAAALRGEK